MTILAIYSNKGGVGKTAAAVKLAYLAAEAYRGLLSEVEEVVLNRRPTLSASMSAPI